MRRPHGGYKRPDRVRQKNGYFDVDKLKIKITEQRRVTNERQGSRCVRPINREGQSSD